MDRNVNLIANHWGLETIEYAVLSGLITAATLAVIGLIGTWLINRYQLVVSTLP